MLKYELHVIFTYIFIKLYKNPSSEVTWLYNDLNISDAVTIIIIIKFISDKSP